MMIRPAVAADRELLLDLWERSVRATHAFVSPADVDAMIPEVREYLGGASEFWVACAVDGTIAGFMGMSGNEMESLFISPDFQRQGVGRLLVAHARHLRPDLTVKVNEANTSARAFYEWCGFVVVDRSELDDQGRPYPLLHLRLRPNA